jgi:hypothetical protein
MPRKVFVGGEILTAADVNTNLMDQAVMVFDDDTARTSAIPSPSEGMVTYRSDEDVVEVFDGSAFVPVGSDPGLVEVKSALFTGTQSASVTASSNVAVTDLSITHELADASNKLIISAFLGAAASSELEGSIGIAIFDGTNLIAIGDDADGRTRVTAGGKVLASTSSIAVSMPSVTFVHSPGAGSKTYTVRAVNIDSTTRTLHINRPVDNSTGASRPRAVSSLVIQEVSV